MIAEILTENLKKATKLPQKRTRYFIKNELKIPKKSLVVLCGTPAAGKSTVANVICEELMNSVHIEIDEICEEEVLKLITDNFLTEEQENLAEKKSFERALKKAETVLKSYGIAVWDDLCIFPKDREKILFGLEGKYDHSILIVLERDITETIFRSIIRGDSQIKTKLIQETHECLQMQLQRVTKYFTGFDDVYILKGDVSISK